MSEEGAFFIQVNSKDEGNRLDVVIASNIVDCTRTNAARLIREGKVKVGNIQRKPGYRVRAGDTIEGYVPEPKQNLCEPEPIPIEFLYEDKHLLVVNKQPGLVVHPAPGHLEGTLINGILYHCPDLAGIGGVLRPGIVHRLDKDTSGVLVVAKNDVAHHRLALQFKNRDVKKKYLVLVHGNMPSESGSISYSIGRHPIRRKMMSIHSRKSRDALTLWKILESYSDLSLIEIDLKTGRTHQIRVHCAAIGHPVVGDEIYTNHSAKRKEKKYSKEISRQMLHAYKLEFVHPITDKKMRLKGPVPEDMKSLIEKLRSEHPLKEFGFDVGMFR